MSNQLSAFVKGYLTAALATGTDNVSELPLDKNFSIAELSDEILTIAQNDCDKFREENERLLEGVDDEQAGIDFWLSRNGEGAGFFCRYELGDRANKLQVAAKKFPSCQLFQGSDGEIYMFRG